MVTSWLAIAGMLALAALTLPSYAQDVPAPQTVRLWDGPAPGALGNADADIPTLTIFAPTPQKKTGSAVVVCPGGGYGGLADYEGKPVAQWLASIGVTGLVLKYRLGPRYHHPVELGDAARAVRYVRAHAAELNLDPTRVGILGFSAGGHLASSLATHFDAGTPGAADPVDQAGSRPDLAMLIYPVITMTDPYGHGGSRTNLLGDHPSAELIDFLSSEKQVTARTPPSFLVTSSDDTVVPFENSLMYAMACHKVGVPVEVHLFEHGPHGFGLGVGDPVLSTWPADCGRWLERHGFLKHK